ncbi:MAG: translation initiation factor IF-2 N-terminal domain-containing protein, partial [Actinomycetota bacterium]|nr:translation initiation factor IF-2 N-terminal domain-containing protein [Actinomycetota bacterium]
MAARIRVYELARELGLSNKETLDLCSALGIGVRSHSSSIEDAQADRVRRKAEREGLVREVAPEEPAPPKPTTSSRRRPPPIDQPSSPGDPDSPAGGIGTAPPADPAHRLVKSRPASEQPDAGSSRPAAAASTLAPPPVPAPAQAPS